jgi:hypothetical protein
VYEVCRPLYGNPSSPRALHKTLDAYFQSEGFEHVGFEESVWVQPKGGKYGCRRHCRAARCRRHCRAAAAAASKIAADAITRD